LQAPARILRVEKRESECSNPGAVDITHARKVDYDVLGRRPKRLIQPFVQRIDCRSEHQLAFYRNHRQAFTLCASRCHSPNGSAPGSTRRQAESVDASVVRTNKDTAI